MNKQLSSISSSKWEIVKVLAGVVLFFTIIGVCFFKIVTPEYMYGYDAAVIDKVARIESIDDPKIILVGNSSTAFGFRSAMIEEAFGMPVVNVGIHGSLGYDFHQNIVKRNLNEGDIVVIAYTDYKGESWAGDPVLIWTAIENNYYLWSLVEPKYWVDMLEAWPTYAKKAITCKQTGTGNWLVDGIYQRYAFNEYGDDDWVDAEDHHMYSALEDDAIALPTEYDEEGLKKLNEFCDYCEKKGATVVITSVPRKSNLEPDYYALDEALELIDAKTNSPVISNQSSYVWNGAYFCEGLLHTNTEGAQLRTSQFITDLDYYLYPEKYLNLGVE